LMEAALLTGGLKNSKAHGRGALLALEAVGVNLRINLVS
jgi:hypothetical protein